MKLTDMPRIIHPQTKEECISQILADSEYGPGSVVYHKAATALCSLSFTEIAYIWVVVFLKDKSK